MFFATGFPNPEENENFHYEPKKSIIDKNLKITWDPETEAFNCSSHEATQLSIKAISCNDPNSCELVEHCFDVV